MKPVLVSIAVLAGLALILIGVDIFAHDATVGEALHDSPKLLGSYIQWVLSLAWQYKFSTAVVFGVAVAILLVRGVPSMWSR